MPSDGIETPLPASLFARLAAATRYTITGVTPNGWFGPQQPLAPQAPPEVKGRQWDYPFGVNLSYVPRSDGDQAFSQYVQFSGVGGASITGLTFTNAPETDAFETANYSITAVPEPGTYALMLSGLGVMGYIARRKRQA